MEKLTIFQPICITEEAAKFLKGLKKRKREKILNFVSNRVEVFEQILKPEEGDRRQPGCGLPCQIVLFEKKYGDEIQILRVVLSVTKEQPLECDVLVVSKKHIFHPSTVFYPR